MINTPLEYSDIRLPKQVQARRLRRVIEQELTDLQREILEDVYFRGKKQVQIAAERGINRSSVCRTLHRAEARLRRFLRY